MAHFLVLRYPVGHYVMAKIKMLPVGHPRASGSTSVERNSFLPVHEVAASRITSNEG